MLVIREAAMTFPLPLCLESIAVRHDGRSASLTAPNGTAQRIMLSAAWAALPVSIAFCSEAHGTGTALGDPTESGALLAAHSESMRTSSLPVSSHKANTGHGEAPSGLLGLLSARRRLQQHLLYGNAQLRLVNPIITSSPRPSSAPLALGTVTTRPVCLHSCGVTGMGHSGTIAHAVLAHAQGDQAGSPRRLRSGTVVPRLTYRRGTFAWRERRRLGVTAASTRRSATHDAHDRLLPSLSEFVNIFQDNVDEQCSAEMDVGIELSLDSLALTELNFALMKAGIDISTELMGVFSGESDERLTLRMLYERAQNQADRHSRMSTIDPKAPMGKGAPPHFPLPPFATPNPLPIVVILTTLRHGSSLTSFILNAHPQLYAPQGLYLQCYPTLKAREAAFQLQPLYLEEGLFATVSDLWNCSLEEAADMVRDWTAKDVPIQLVYHWIQERCAPRILVDRGNTNYCYRQVVARAETMWSKIRFIHVTRHPYDVMRSGLSMLGRTLRFRGVDVDEEALMLQIELAYTIAHTEAKIALERVSAEKHIRTSYETIMDRTEETCRRVCTLIGIPFHPDMLNPYASAKNELHAVRGESGVAAVDPKLFQQQKIGRRQATKLQDPLSTFGRCVQPETRRVAEHYGYQMSASASNSPSCKLLGGPHGLGDGMVVCVPGSDGSCHHFSPICARLERQRCLVLGLDFAEPMPRNAFRTQAEFFSGQLISRLTQVQPDAPLILLGYSSGTALAHELALVCRGFVPEARIHLLLVDRNPWNGTEPIEPASCGVQTAANGHTLDGSHAAGPRQRTLLQRFARTLHSTQVLLPGPSATCATCRARVLMRAPHDCPPLSYRQVPSRRDLCRPDENVSSAGAHRAVAPGSRARDCGRWCHALRHHGL